MTKGYSSIPAALKYFGLVWAFLVFSCSPEINEFRHTYVSSFPDVFTMGFQILKEPMAYNIGTPLYLYEDSTFMYKACSIQYGNYTVRQDTLWLQVTRHEWANDSLQEFGFNGVWPQAGGEFPMLIRGRHLVSDDEVRIGSSESSPNERRKARRYVLYEKVN
jgi:hypothetical protein